MSVTPDAERTVVLACAAAHGHTTQPTEDG
jgi:hypothetical protein